MNQYVTGTVIKELREKSGMTQLQLAEQLRVSDKTISKWESIPNLGDGTDLREYHTECECFRQYAALKVLCVSGLRERDP